MALQLEEDRPLAPSTSFGLGGPARWYVEARDDATVVEALRWARERDLDAVMLGGGSNLVVADEGLEALVVHVAMRGLEVGGDGRVVAAAGEPWDSLVARVVAENLAGFECLSGIPGLVGATPIQNVGAYGQDVSETLVRVRVVDRESLEVGELAPHSCELSYRDSFFKRNPGRYVVLGVTYELEAGGEPTIRYAELERALADSGETSLRGVRETVLALRRNKSMVIDPDDENRRSAGSFFTNPIVPDAEADRVVQQALDDRIVDDASAVPRWPVAPGTTKLAAGWLVERSGIPKGFRRGPVGVSSRHALALVHHGGGTTAELLSLARHVRDTVRDRFGVALVPEPVILGTEL